MKKRSSSHTSSSRQSQKAARRTREAQKRQRRAEIQLAKKAAALGYDRIARKEAA